MRGLYHPPGRPASATGPVPKKHPEPAGGFRGVFDALRTPHWSPGRTGTGRPHRLVRHHLDKSGLLRRRTGANILAKLPGPCRASSKASSGARSPLIMAATTIWFGGIGGTGVELTSGARARYRRVTAWPNLPRDRAYVVARQGGAMETMLIYASPVFGAATMTRRAPAAVPVSTGCQLHALCLEGRDGPAENLSCTLRGPR